MCLSFFAYFYLNLESHTVVCKYFEEKKHSCTVFMQSADFQLHNCIFEYVNTNILFVNHDDF